MATTEIQGIPTSQIDPTKMYDCHITFIGWCQDLGCNGPTMRKMTGRDFLKFYVKYKITATTETTNPKHAVPNAVARTLQDKLRYKKKQARSDADMAAKLASDNPHLYGNGAGKVIGKSEKVTAKVAASSPEATETPTSGFSGKKKKSSFQSNFHTTVTPAADTAGTEANADLSIEDAVSSAAVTDKAE